jgi:hypothetical protein
LDQDGSSRMSIFPGTKPHATHCICTSCAEYVQHFGRSGRQQRRTVERELASSTVYVYHFAHLIRPTTLCRVKHTAGTNSSSRMEWRCWLMRATRSLLMTSLTEVEAAKTDKEAPVVHIVTRRGRNDGDKVCST